METIEDAVVKALLTNCKISGETGVKMIYRGKKFGGLPAIHRKSKCLKAT
jgi:hypothetical protein